MAICSCLSSRKKASERQLKNASGTTTRSSPNKSSSPAQSNSNGNKSALVEKIKGQQSKSQKSIKHKHSGKHAVVEPTPSSQKNNVSRSSNSLEQTSGVPLPTPTLTGGYMRLNSKKSQVPYERSGTVSGETTRTSHGDPARDHSQLTKNFKNKIHQNIFKH